MPDNNPALVVVAAGGLGTRVQPWARFIPKEFYPVRGRPGITLLLEEIAGLGQARVVIVYHPYYEQFAAWVRQVLSRHDHARYSDAAGTDVPAAVPPGLAVSLIPQHGPERWPAAAASSSRDPGSPQQSRGECWPSWRSPPWPRP